MNTLAKKLAARLTRKNFKWFLRVNVVGWVIQGAIIGVLSVCGMEAFAAMVTAKVSSWVVFVAQCVKAAKS